jgi:hypothetical protein
LRDFNLAYVRVTFDSRGRSDTSLFVRFAPKATFTNQDVIRRFVPIAETAGDRKPYLKADVVLLQRRAYPS